MWDQATRMMDSFRAEPFASFLGTVRNWNEDNLTTAHVAFLIALTRAYHCEVKSTTFKIFLC
jgi:hypothetical protein